jgi:hypothetical protein
LKLRLLGYNPITGCVEGAGRKSKKARTQKRVASGNFHHVEISTRPASDEFIRP